MILEMTIFVMIFGDDFGIVLRKILVMVFGTIFESDDFLMIRG